MGCFPLVNGGVLMHLNIDFTLTWSVFIILYG